MTDDAHDAYAADDAILLYLVRDGDTTAYQVLRQRHEQAALRLARCLVPAPEARDLAARAFARVLDITLRGGGPVDAFRPYLLTAVRQVGNDGAQPERAGSVAAETGELPDPGEPLINSEPDGLQTSPIVRAFRSLPERWIAVLWHTEIEQADPAEVSPILGLAPGDVATLQRRAWDGLRQAYLEVHIADGARPECQPVVRLLAAYVDGSASSRDSAMVAEHLSHCDDCDAIWAELADIDAAALRAVVAPVFLGTMAAAYLPADKAGPAAGATAGGTRESMDTREWDRPEHGEQRELELSRRRHASGPSHHSHRRSLWIIGVTVAAAVVVLALAVTRLGAPPTSAHHQQLPQAAVAPTPGGSGTGTPTPSPQNATKATASPTASQPGSRDGAAGSNSSTGTGPNGNPEPSQTANPTPSGSGPTPSPTPPEPTPSPTPSAGAGF